MSVNNISASGGVFTITSNGVAQQVDLGTLMMMLNLERTSSLDEQIAIQVNEIKDRNFMVKAATAVLTKLRELKSTGADDGYSNLALSGSWSVDITVDGITLPLQGIGVDSWCSRLGITYTDMTGARPSKEKDAKIWDDKMEANIQNVKSAIDVMNNDSQLDNIKLQNLLEKRNNAFEMASKVMSTNNSSVQSVLRNL